MRSATRAGLAVLVAVTSLGAGSVPARDTAQGWRPLFNGRDLSGWQSFDGSAPKPEWTVRDGVLMLTRSDGRMGGHDLVTAESFGAFELSLEWKVARGGNSGILYLARNVAGARQLHESGLEMQVLDDAGHPDGATPTHRAGALYDIAAPPPGAARPAGAWNHARVLVERGRVRQWLNGTLTADLSYGDRAWRDRVARSKFAAMPMFGTFDRGVIGLQDHGDPVAFRNIRIRPIGPSATAR